MALVVHGSVGFAGRRTPELGEPASQEGLWCSRKYKGIGATTVQMNVYVAPEWFENRCAGAYVAEIDFEDAGGGSRYANP